MKKIGVFCGGILISLSAFAIEQSKRDNHCPYGYSQVVAFEKQFLKMMIKHHNDGIKMMDIAIQKSNDELIVTMSKKMRSDQIKDVDQMTTMISELPAGSNENYKMPGMVPMDMTKLKNASGKEFDTLYLKDMIQHHKGGIEMSEYVIPCAKDKKVRDKAESIDKKQKQEIKKMENMLGNE